MWELDHKEGWALKSWCFWLWCLRSLLRVPWTSRKSSQSFLKEISPEYTLERLMLKLKLQYFCQLMWRASSSEKTDVGTDWKWEKKGTTDVEIVEWYHQLNGHEFEQAPGDGEEQERLVSCSPSVCKELNTTEWLNMQRVGHDWATELTDWTE